MKKISFLLILSIGILLFPNAVNALNWIDGYWRGNEWVEGHWRTDPDGYEWNNLGSDGIDMDNDGYGTGNTNNLYDSYDFNSYDYDYNYDYDYGLDTLDTGSLYDSNDYDIMKI